MATLAQDGKPVKTKSRRIVSRRLTCTPASVGHWLTIRQTYTDGSVEQTVYAVDSIPSDMGRSFEMTRLEGDDLLGYRVHLSGDGRQHCERTTGQPCPSFRRHGSTCKHCDSLRAAIAAGKLGAVGYPGGEPECDDCDECDE